jgi:hypothetical protein
MALTKLNYTGQGTIPIASIPTITGTKMPAGSVIQIPTPVLSNTITVHNTTSFTNTNLVLSITPTSTSSKVLVTSSFNVRTYHNGYQCFGRVGLYRGSTLLATRDVNTDGSNTARWMTFPCGFVYLDSPSTTSATEYRIKARVLWTTYSAQLDVGYFYNDSGNDETNQQTLILQEIAG